MASNAPRVYREQTTFQNQKIGVARVYEGSQTGRAIVNGANRLAAQAFQFAAEDAQQIGEDQGKGMALDQIMAINPETGEPQAISGMKGLGRIASRAYGRVIETRFKQNIEEELMNRGKVLAAQFPTDPDAYSETYGDYIASMVGNAKGKWAEYIREVGTNYLNRTRAAIVANNLRASRASYASSTKRATESGNQALQSITRELGPSAFMPTLGSLSAEPGGPGEEGLYIGKFLGPTGEIRPGFTSQKLTFGNVTPSAPDPDYAVSDAQQLRDTVAPNTLMSNPPWKMQRTSSPIPEFVNAMLFETGPAPSPIEAQPNFGTIGGQLAQSIMTGAMDAMYADVVSEAAVAQFGSEQRANIVIGLVGYALDQMDKTDPNSIKYMNRVKLALETQDWRDLSNLVPGVSPFVRDVFGGSELKLMNTILSADITDYKSVISDNVKEQKELAKLLADEAQRARILSGEVPLVGDEKVIASIDFMASKVNNPSDFVKAVRAYISEDLALAYSDELREIVQESRDGGSMEVFEQRVKSLRESTTALIIRPLQLLAMQQSYGTKEREALIAALATLENGGTVRTDTLPQEAVLALQAVQAATEFFPDALSLANKELTSFFSDTDAMLKEQEKIESETAAADLAGKFAEAMEMEASRGVFKSGDFLEQIEVEERTLRELPNLPQTKFNAVMQTITREAMRYEVNHLTGRFTSIEQFHALESYMETGSEDSYRLLANLAGRPLADAAASIRPTIRGEATINDSMSGFSDVLSKARSAFELRLNETARDRKLESARASVDAGQTDVSDKDQMAYLSGKVSDVLSSVIATGLLAGDPLSSSMWGSEQFASRFARDKAIEAMVGAGAIESSLFKAFTDVANGRITETDSFSSQRVIDYFSDMVGTRAGYQTARMHFEQENKHEEFADLVVYADVRGWMTEEAFREFVAADTTLSLYGEDVKAKVEAVLGSDVGSWLASNVDGYDGLLPREQRSLVRMASVYAGMPSATEGLIKDRIASFSHNFYEEDPTGKELFYRRDQLGNFRNATKVPIDVAFSLSRQMGGATMPLLTETIDGYLSDLAVKVGRPELAGNRSFLGSVGDAIVGGSSQERFALVEEGWTTGRDGLDYIAYSIYTYDPQTNNLQAFMVDGKHKFMSGADDYFQVAFRRMRALYSNDIREKEILAREEAANNAAMIQTDRRGRPIE